MMHAFEISDLLEQQQATDQPYFEFVRVPDLSAGLYVLPADGEDLQQPHSEDEVYYVVSGVGRFRSGAEDRPVLGGTFIYVPAGVPHHFHSIEEDLVILVVFAPAEGTQS